MHTFIARVWHGRVAVDRSEQYLQLMHSVAIADYRRTPGNRGAFCAHRREGEIVHIYMISLWDSVADIAAFAGEDVTLAKYYDFDNDFLLEKELRVLHLEATGVADHLFGPAALVSRA